MPTVLLTGASRGLGLEFTRQYAKEGWRVIATCRDPKKADGLRGVAGTVEIQPLDVADFAAVERFGKKQRGETIDLLIANAGINPLRTMTAEHVEGDAWAETFRVNAMAPLAVAGALREPLARAGAKAIAIGSRMGSIALNEGGHYAYRSSKAALNMVWNGFARDNPAIIAVVLHPGWVSTDMGGASAPVTPPESVAGMRKVIAGLGKKDSGGFFAFDGEKLPW